MTSVTVNYTTSSQKFLQVLEGGNLEALDDLIQSFQILRRCSDSPVYTGSCGTESREILAHLLNYAMRQDVSPTRQGIWLIEIPNTDLVEGFNDFLTSKGIDVQGSLSVVVQEYLIPDSKPSPAWANRDGPPVVEMGALPEGSPTSAYVNQ